MFVILLGNKFIKARHVKKFKP